MRLNYYIERIQEQDVSTSSAKVENLINESVSRINFLLDAVLDDDVDKIKHDSVGWVFIDLVAKNVATEEKPFNEELIEYSYSEYNNLNKRKLVELLLRLSLNLNLDQNYSNANVIFAINTLFAVCDFYGLSLDECVRIELNS